MIIVYLVSRDADKHKFVVLKLIVSSSYHLPARAIS